MQPLFIAIIGASGAGKTTVAKLLAEHYQNRALIIAEDTYFYGKKAENENIDQPSAVEHDLLLTHLKLLKAGYTIEQPVYDHQTLSRQTQTITTPPSEIIIVEGLFLLAHPDLSKMFDVSVYVHVPKDIALIRRLDRDQKHRALSVQANLMYYPNVRLGFLNYIRPHKDKVNFVFDNIDKTNQDENLKLLISLVSNKFEKYFSTNIDLPQQPKSKL